MGKTDWDIVTNFVDAVTTTLKTVTFPKVQEQVYLRNQGNANFTYTIGSQSGALTPGQSVTVNEDVSSFTLQAVSGTHTFEVRAKEKGTEINETDSTNTIEEYSKRMKNLSTVTIGCHGDSTYWGHASGVDPLGTQVATPAPVALQTVLRSYYNNPNITVINNGVKGQKTSDVISDWDTTMKNSAADIIFINWGINDGKDDVLTPQQYRDNLQSMVLTARKRNKVVILETPNVVLSADYAVDGMGTPARSENIKQFAQVMRKVAEELNVPLVDNYLNTQKYVEHFKYVPTCMPDGMHPSQEMYIYKAMQMAGMFIKAEKLSKKTLLPAASSAVRGYGYPDTINTGSSGKSKSGTGRFAQNLKIAVFVEESGVDLYVGTPIWSTGSNNCQIVVDNSVVKNINVNDPNYSSDYPIDVETLTVENVCYGLHVIELNNLDAGTNRQMGFYYLQSRPTFVPERLNYGSVAAATNVRQPYITLQDFEYTQPSTGEIHLLTDIPTSRTYNMVDVEVTSIFGKKDGFVVFGHQNFSGVPRGGFLLFLNANGYLSYGEGAFSGGVNQYINVTQVDTVDLSLASHKYRLTCNTTGLITVYVDGVQKFTYQLTVNYWGGFFGFYHNQAGTARIDKVSFFR